MRAADYLDVWCRRCRAVCDYECGCPDGPQWPLVTEAELDPIGTIYLAHPVSEYGGPRQARAIAALKRAGFAIENPDQPHHQAAYKEQGMPYFIDLVGQCDGLAFMRFPNGWIGAGVAKEIIAARLLGKMVLEVTIDSKLRPLSSGEALEQVATIDQTRAYLRGDTQWQNCNSNATGNAR